MKSGESGFTLVEALIAILVLVAGLVAIVNLFTVALMTNVRANQMTGAAAMASQQLEELKRVPFQNLQLGGATNPTCNPAGTPPTVASHRQENLVDGVGVIRTCWEIQQVAGDPQMYFIKVVSVGTGTGPTSRAEFATFRSCTDPEIGCPAMVAGP
jgi:type II secretory pathway pseudopilin PulG